MMLTNSRVIQMKRYRRLMNDILLSFKDVAN